MHKLPTNFYPILIHLMVTFLRLVTGAVLQLLTADSHETFHMSSNLEVNSVSSGGICDCDDEHQNSKQHCMAVTLTRLGSGLARDLALASSRSKRFTSSQNRLLLGSTQPPVQTLPTDFSPLVKRPRHEPDPTHLPVPTLRTNGVILPFSYALTEQKVTTLPLPTFKDESGFFRNVGNQYPRYST